MEVHITTLVRSLGVNDRKVVSSILSLDLTKSGGDNYAIDIRDSAVQWVNDIENDSRYKRWSSHLMDLLKPTFPGMLRSVKRNLYNLVCDHLKLNFSSLAAPEKL